MGLYIRKSFKAGPVRFNLSKSGVGTSFGTKGIRVGSSSHGRSYVHAGRGGVYYRKNIGTGIPSGCILVLLPIGLLLVNLFIQIAEWMSANPIAPISICVISLFFGIIWKISRKGQKEALGRYEEALNNAFLFNENIPDEATIKGLIKKQKKAQEYSSEENLKGVEEYVYSTLIHKAVEDQYVSEKECKTIKILESIVCLPDIYKTLVKKEVFQHLYLDVVADNKIDSDEIKKLESYLHGLNLCEFDVEDELKVIHELIKMQGLCLPLTPIKTSIQNIQKKEIVYYEGEAKVLSRRKINRASNGEYRFSVRREGRLVITNKRLLVINEGVTKLNLKDILDIDVDLDNSMIVFSRENSSLPVFIESYEPMYLGKMIDLLIQGINNKTCEK